MLIFIALLTIAIALFIYIVTAKALSKVAKHIGASQKLAWVPILNVFIIYKAVEGKLWLCWTYVVTYVATELIPESIGDTDPLITFLVLLIDIAFIISAIYQIIMIYRFTRKYDCSLVLFWIGIIIFPVHVYLYWKIGKVAEQRYLEEQEQKQSLIE